ncbi:MAG TPA: hypothetical protein VFZ77_14765 [Acidimicrobiales bacterium]
MDVLSLLRLVSRHWRVTVPAVALTLLGVFAAVQLSSPTYQSTGSVLLLNPPPVPETDNPEAIAPDNPYTRFNDLSVIADIIARVMAGDATRAVLEERGVSGYEVVANRFSRGPMIEVTGEAATAEAAVRSAEVALGEVEAVLLERQAAEGTDPRYYITSEPLQQPTTATAVYGSTVRAAIAALAFGALCTLALAVLAEAVVTRRAARRGDEPAEPVEEDVSPGTERDTRPAIQLADPTWIGSGAGLAGREPRESSAGESSGPGAPAGQPSAHDPPAPLMSALQQAAQQMAGPPPARQAPGSPQAAQQAPGPKSPKRRRTGRQRSTPQKPAQPKAASESGTDNGDSRAAGRSP